MADIENGSDRENLALVKKLLGIVNSSWMSQAVRVASELGVADLLASGPQGVAELARATGCHAPSLKRLMRALTSLDLCQELKDGTYELTQMGSLLRADAAYSVRSWTLWWGKYLWPVWANLLHSVKTGESARKLVTGTKGFEHLELDAEMAAIFNRAMVDLTRLVARAVVRAYDFSGMQRIVDVGGGQGELLATILRAHSETRGILFDLPHAIEGARQHLAGRGVEGRCELVAGSFFESVPGGADAYLLKSVIDDWDDEDGAVILQTCRRAMPAGAKLLLIEPFMPEQLEASPLHQAMARVDLNMLVTHGARERTEPEFRNLLEAQNFRVARIVATDANFNIIEATPR